MTQSKNNDKSVNNIVNQSKKDNKYLGANL